MRFGICHIAYVFFALMMMMSISANTIRLISGGNENKLAVARRLAVKVEINDYQEPGASTKHLPPPPGDEFGDKAQDHQ
ncbi:hypothetical protein NC653_022804 [Populus alba x Populus x berolinensis]|uniref:Uncharacterized protein n=2 Tax=Populus TaxID=3689 RepID=A0A8X7Z0T7_POPTO|nr:hypothetical protein POTOM_032775 [Populus tomentosa]KAJ6984618.1 hypothetical protein NC653_022798 [Populus alba x Populus x berolinensis]KAJ6984624.1 hypothetical protein NC653_022804 [Populus alba x Populus x berolinensis]